MKLLGKERTEIRRVKDGPRLPKDTGGAGKRGNAKKGCKVSPHLFHLHCQYCERIEEIQVAQVLEEAGR